MTAPELLGRMNACWRAANDLSTGRQVVASIDASTYNRETPEIRNWKWSNAIKGGER